ncbi:MAG: DUF1467 family protein [Sphingosinicella sp.]
MRFTSAAAIYVLFWFLCLFVVLPWGVRTSEEAGRPNLPGQAESAPDSFSFARVAARTTILSALLFAAYYAIYVNGWIDPDSLDWAR